MNTLNIILSLVFIALSCYYDNWYITLGYCTGVGFMALNDYVEKHR